MLWCCVPWFWGWWRTSSSSPVRVLKKRMTPFENLCARSFGTSPNPSCVIASNRFVWARYPKAGAVCHSMIRRYLENERRSHDTHWDIPSYVSVVVSLDSTNQDFEGGFFVTTGNGEKSFIPLQKGDTVVHQSDLLHGVHVVSGERWSWAMWFQDSSDCSSAAENWWQAEAEEGDPVAQTLRAMRASTAMESWTWLKSAAQSGFPRAQLYFGKAHEDRADWLKGVMLL